MNMDIGGYGQLDIKMKNNGIHKNALAFQSARACLYFFLKNVKAKVLYLPSYICNSLLPAVNELGIEIRWFSINNELLPVTIPNLNKGEFFLIVNYFGLLTEKIKGMVSSQKGNIIIDNSQSLFTNPLPFAATIYSPRKFLAIPDGGFIYSGINIEEELDFYDASEHINHLVLRAVGETQEGYARFLLAEKALDNFYPKKMSKIASFLTRVVDLERLKVRRQKNFTSLNKEFGTINQLRLVLDENDVPLCYPLKLKFNISNMHEKLIGYDIFLPRYWSDVYLRNDASFERGIYDQTLFIPVDERISDLKLNFMIEKINIEILKY